MEALRDRIGDKIGGKIDDLCNAGAGPRWVNDTSGLAPVWLHGELHVEVHDACDMPGERFRSLRHLGKVPGLSNAFRALDRNVGRVTQVWLGC